MRYWSEEEARAYLPRLRQLIGILQEKRPGQRAKGNGHHAEGDDDVAAAAAELESGSIVLRQLKTGLVDFPARGPDGVDYYLCWRLDDGDLAYWHMPDEGFAGRKPLPREPAR